MPAEVEPPFGETPRNEAAQDAEVFDMAQEDPVNWAPRPGSGIAAPAQPNTGIDGPRQPASHGGGGNTGTDDGGDGNGGGGSTVNGEDVPTVHTAGSLPVDPCPGPPPAPEFANAFGTATVVHVRETILLDTDVSLVQISAAQHGVGTNTDEEQLLTFTVPDPTGSFDHILRADIAHAKAESSVSREDMESTQHTVAELLNLSVLDGFVTAQLVRAEALTRATPHHAEWSSDGSVLEGLLIDGQPTETSKPWFTIDLADEFGPGSKIALLERVGHIHTPVKPIDGFAADLKINMIHVILADANPLVTGDQTLEIILSQLHSHADFPEEPGCRPNQGVHGYAYNLHATANLPAMPVTLGFSDLPRLGGDEDQHVLRVDVAGNEVNVSSSRAAGAVPVDRSWAHTHSELLEVCLLRSADGTTCAISASLVRVEAFAQVTSEQEIFTRGVTVIAELKIGGQDICPTIDPDGFCRPEPNTEINVLGLATIILNEQVPVPTETPHCHAAVKVRGIHVIPHSLEADVIVGEALAGAFYCPNPALEPSA